MTFDEHPDELTLVGWSEQRLLEFEQEAVERHLSGCARCRALVAGHATASRGPARRPSVLWLLAAAAIFVAAVIGPFGFRDEPATPPLELALAGRARDLFATTRSAPARTGELHVGLRLEEEAWVRLVAVDSAGEIHEVPLDPEGTRSARYSGGADHAFGPFPIELTSGARVERLFALASHEFLAWHELANLDWNTADAVEASVRANVVDALLSTP